MHNISRIQVCRHYFICLCVNVSVVVLLVNLCWEWVIGFRVQVSIDLDHMSWTWLWCCSIDQTDLSLMFYHMLDDFCISVHHVSSTLKSLIKPLPSLHCIMSMSETMSIKTSDDRCYKDRIKKCHVSVFSSKIKEICELNYLYHFFKWN